jgi:mono/diheme cytochrome c family protein
MQWWMNAVGASDFSFVPTFLQGYNYVISGKPEFSLPANIPIIFETTVMLAALGAVFGMLAMNNLPLHHKPLLASERFKRVTADRFFVAIDATDPKFDTAATAELLSSLGGSEVERVEEVPGRLQTPSALVIGTIIVITLALLPPLFVAKARLSKSTEPRIHLIQDMDNQERFKAQQAAPLLFADGRAGRASMPNTIARGDWPVDSHFDKGRSADWRGDDTDDEHWAATYPPQVEISESFVRRGQERFNIYCSTCHGLGGQGDGVIARRALELETEGWVAPTSLTDDVVRDRPHGHVFNSISRGIRSMAPYGDQIPPADRWAIVAYIRALQRSQRATVEDVPPEVRSELR